MIKRSITAARLRKFIRKILHDKRKTEPPVTLADIEKNQLKDFAGAAAGEVSANLIYNIIIARKLKNINQNFNL